VTGELELEEGPRGVTDADDLELVERDGLVAGLAQEVEQQAGVLEQQIHGHLYDTDRLSPFTRCG
jgi:hypothetical protein